MITASSPTCNADTASSSNTGLCPVAITFHSGEDRMVKRFISEREGRCVCPPELPVCVCGASPIFRRGPVLRPTEDEVRENPRSASARLRSAIRTAEPAGDA